MSQYGVKGDSPGWSCTSTVQVLEPERRFSVRYKRSLSCSHRSSYNQLGVDNHSTVPSLHCRAHIPFSLLHPQYGVKGGQSWLTVQLIIGGIPEWYLAQNLPILDPRPHVSI